MQEISLRRKEGAYEPLSVSGKEIASEPGWDHTFQVANVVRRVDGGTYNRSRIAEVAQEEKYRRDYSLGFPSLVREENLEPSDEKASLSELQRFRSSDPPVVHARSLVSTDEAREKAEASSFKGCETNGEVVMPDLTEGWSKEG